MSNDVANLTDLEAELANAKNEGVEAAERQLELATKVLEAVSKTIEETKKRHATELSELDTRERAAQRAKWQATRALENAKKAPKRTPRVDYTT